MKSFCYAIEQLSGTNVHSLSNNITIQSDVHEWFTRLEIWFEKTPTPPYPDRLVRTTRILQASHGAVTVRPSSVQMQRRHVGRSFLPLLLLLLVAAAVPQGARGARTGAKSVRWVGWGGVGKGRRAGTWPAKVSRLLPTIAAAMVAG